MIDDCENEIVLQAIENESNSPILKLTFAKIKATNLSIINQLHLSKNETKLIMKKLQDYRFINKPDEVKSGAYIRWIPLTDPDDIFLTKGAIICNVDDYGCTCRNLGMGKHFNINFVDNLIFQKLTQQELIILHAIDCLLTQKKK